MLLRCLRRRKRSLKTKALIFLESNPWARNREKIKNSKKKKIRKCWRAWNNKSRRKKTKWMYWSRSKLIHLPFLFLLSLLQLNKQSRCSKQLWSMLTAIFQQLSTYRIYIWKLESQNNVFQSATNFWSRLKTHLNLQN